MFERFDQAARETVVRAQEEARSLHHPYLASEHFLVALARPESPMADTLLGLGVAREGLRAAIARRRPGAAEVPTGQIPFTVGARALLERAVEEADAADQDTVEAKHLLLAALKGDHAGPLLADLGVPVADVRAAVLGDS